MSSGIKVLVGKSEGRPTHGMEDNIKMDLPETWMGLYILH
jgi:hypothetical protein